jgi:hypothetical protein
MYGASEPVVQTWSGIRTRGRLGVEEVVMSYLRP